MEVAQISHIYPYIIYLFENGRPRTMVLQGYQIVVTTVLYQKSKIDHILTFIINIKPIFKDMTTGILITFYLQLQYKSKAGSASATIFCNISHDL